MPIPVTRALATVALLLLLVSTSVLAENDELRPPAATFPDVTNAWRSGNPQGALALLERRLAAGPADAAPRLEALVLRATLLTETGQPQEAEAVWGEVIERKVWMRTFARRAIVESLVERGAVTEAEPALAELNGADPTRHLDLTLRVAKTHAVTGSRRAAWRLYQDVLSRQTRGPFADRARLGLAKALEQDGEIDRALVQLREAKLQHWQADTFEAAAQMERRILDGNGRSAVPLRGHEYRTLVRRLRNASRFERALALIDEWRAAHAPATGSANIEADRIATLYAQRANEQAVAACQAFYERFPHSSLIPDIRLTDFRLAVRMVDPNRARRTGLNIWEGRVPAATSQHRRDAATLLAAFQVATGDTPGGLDLYRQLFASAQSPDEQRLLLWRVGVAALKDGQYERALTNLRALNSRRPTGDLAPAGLYWLAVAESHADRSAARQTMNAVAQRYPYHYYGMRARERLAGGGSGGDLVLTFPDLTIAPSTTARAEYQAASLLARAGRVDDSAWYFGRLLDRRPQDKGLALMTARAFAAAGNYASVSRVLVNHFGAYLEQSADRLPPDFWELVYPRPYWNDISRSGRAHNVDPLLLLSLMRQESRFDPDARSPVGAIGLFQIMTYTAEALAARAGVEEVLVNGSIDRTALAQPAINSAIAARLTSDLFAMFDGSAAPVIASYNAGEERVAVWWAAARGLSEDYFVDTIPYSETRRFVREVLANRAAYERTYGDQ